MPSPWANTVRRCFTDDRVRQAITPHGSPLHREDHEALKHGTLDKVPGFPRKRFPSTYIIHGSRARRTSYTWAGRPIYHWNKGLERSARTRSDEKARGLDTKPDWLPTPLRLPRAAPATHRRDSSHKPPRQKIRRWRMTFDHALLVRIACPVTSHVLSLPACGQAGRP